MASTVRYVEKTNEEPSHVKVRLSHYSRNEALDIYTRSIKTTPKLKHYVPFTISFIIYQIIFCKILNKQCF